MKTWVWISAIIVVVALVSSFYIISENLNPEHVQFPMETTKEQPNTNSEQSDTDSEQPGTTATPSSNTQLNENPSSNSNPPATNTQNCFQQQIPYSLTELEEEEDTSTICKLNIKNLDYETSGEFSINFTFSNLNQEQIKSEIITFTLQPRQDKIFQSGTETSNAICKYQTIKIPTKQICY